MWQDLARGTRTEVDALNGAVVVEARRLGLAAPHNAALVHFLHSRERQKFLNREAIARKLGLDQAQDAPGKSERPRAPARAPPLGAAPPQPGPGPGPGPPRKERAPPSPGAGHADGTGRRDALGRPAAR